MNVSKEDTFKKIMINRMGKEIESAMVKIEATVSKIECYIQKRNGEERV